MGQVVLDSLAERFQVPLNYDRSVMGWIGNTEIEIPPPPQKGKGKGKQTADAEPAEPERVKFTFLKPSKSLTSPIQLNRRPLTSLSAFQNS